MWHFRAFVQGMAGGHGALHGPFSASCGHAARQDTSTELGVWVGASGTGDTAFPHMALEGKPAAEPQQACCTLRRRVALALLYIVPLVHPGILSFFLKKTRLLHSSVGVSRDSLQFSSLV